MRIRKMLISYINWIIYCIRLTTASLNIQSKYTVICANDKFVYLSSKYPVHCFSASLSSYSSVWSSLYPPIIPDVTSQAYAFPSTLHTITTTQTLKGITHKSILCTYLLYNIVLLNSWHKNNFILWPHLIFRGTCHTVCLQHMRVTTFAEIWL